MKRIIVLLILLSVFPSIIYSQDAKLQIDSIDKEIIKHQIAIDELNKEKEVYLFAYIKEQLKKYGLPKVNEGEMLIQHKAYMLVYSEKDEQAKWVAHIIPTAIINSSAERTNNFRPDTLITTGSAVEADYFLKHKENGKMVYDGFGYDRGHLAPSADFKWSKTALSESFYYSNMSPQLGDFNRGGWAKLEAMMRKYVVENNVDLFIVTGPVLTDNLSVIERSVDKISIPKYYYKIAYDKNNNRAIAFLFPNEKINYPPEYYAVSIDSIETITNIDFFYNLNDSIEDIIEKQTDYKVFLPKKYKNDVAPLKYLPKNCYNSIQAYSEINTGKKIKVCGTVVSTHKSKKGNIFINLDKSYPNQIFSITIWASDIDNFSYDIIKELKGKKICVIGKITEYKGIASMYISNEKLIDFMDGVTKYNP